MGRSTRQCSFRDLSEQARRAIQTQMPESDQALYCFDTHQEQGSEWHGDAVRLYYAAVITNASLIIYNETIYLQGKKVQPSTQRLHLAEVVEISPSSPGERRFDVWVRAANGQSVSFQCVKQSDAQKFERILRTQIDSVKNVSPLHSSQPSPTTGVDQRTWKSDKSYDMRVKSGDFLAGRTPEERLRYLRNLHAEGLITDEEYAQKRREILAEL